ncbi:MAG: penicillin-binding protein 2 [Tannerella sp.]|jgi:penicillin-binding protein 2|nr:penicillin-binding protein 2 [Tannerella sp.]
MKQNEKYILESRRYIIIGVVLCVVAVFVIRLFMIQVVDSQYKNRADNNALVNKILYPARGVIYDRNDNLLVYNQSTFEVMLVMRDIQPFDTLDFCRTLGITKEFFDNRIEEIKDTRRNPGYSSYTPQVFRSQLSATESGIFQEKMYKFPGFYIQNRPIRMYGTEHAALLLGYIGEVNNRDIEKDKFYIAGDYSGRTGVEQSYENLLRGEKGIEILLRDAHGRIIGKYEDGKHDKTPVPGTNLKLAIDIELQAYGEKLLQNKVGSVVMIEPETGEILCLVSSPSYDPSLLVGRQRSPNYAMLESNPLKPLFDRSIMSMYSPGSTFKPAQGLVFLEAGTLTPNKLYTCANGFTLPGMNGKPGCHSHGSPLSLVGALATSCNSYFCWGLHDMLDDRRIYPTVQEAFDKWRSYMTSLGYGTRLGIDMPSENRGYLPTSQFYDNMNKGRRWSSRTIISTAIGQGEILATPLQICNLAAIIANRGYYVVPHIVKNIENNQLDSTYTSRRRTAISSEHFDSIVEGMRNAVVYGTCTGLYMPDIEVCGKTGTVENFKGRDHSACIAFAPRENPKVAISVFIENGGWGAENAIPVARLMLEKMLYGEVSQTSKWIEDRVMRTVILPYYVQ